MFEGNVWRVRSAADVEGKGEERDAAGEGNALLCKRLMAHQISAEDETKCEGEAGQQGKPSAASC